MDQRMTPEEGVKTLLRIMEMAPMSVRVIILQTYISEYGPIPNAYREQVVNLLEGKQDPTHQ